MVNEKDLKKYANGVLSIFPIMTIPETKQAE